jgi:hypothetical protein
MKRKNKIEIVGVQIRGLIKYISMGNYILTIIICRITHTLAFLSIPLPFIKPHSFVDCPNKEKNKGAVFFRSYDN